MEISILESLVMFVGLVVGACQFIPEDKPEPPSGNGLIKTV